MTTNLMRKNAIDDFFDMVFSGKTGDAIDRFFDPVHKHLPAVSVPFVNMRNVDGGIQVELAAPGLSKESFDVRVKDSRLRISSKTSSKSEEEAPTYKYREYNYGEFVRFVDLPKNANVTGLKAQYVDGILNIFIPVDGDQGVVEIEVE